MDSAEWTAYDVEKAKSLNQEKETGKDINVSIRLIGLIPKFEETDKELEKKADEYVTSTGNNDCTFDAYVDGYVAKENSIVWHDLRKKPEDKPEENHTVLLLTTTEPVIAQYDAQIQAFFRMNEHSKYCVYVDLKTCIAWCEVPVFTKGD